MVKTKKTEEEFPALLQELISSYTSYPDLSNISSAQIPLLERVIKILSMLNEVIFPGYYGPQNLTEDKLLYHLGHKMFHLYEDLSQETARSYRHKCELGSTSKCDQCIGRAQSQVMIFMKKLPEIRAQLNEDLIAAYRGDPAAKSYDEIIFSYPGFHAITAHRCAHQLYLQNIPILPRMINEHIHHITGVDIHPGASIGSHFFIDHGTGVVIGETTHIGNNVKIYQGVTLGALSFPMDKTGELIRHTKRHPTIEDNVTIYSGATLLGGKTVIGEGSIIGGNVWLTTSIPPGTKVIIESPRLKYAFKSPPKKEKKFVLDFQI